MALGRCTPRRRYCPNVTRHQSQHARRRQHHSRTFFQLGAQHRRRPSCRLAHLVHDRASHSRDRARRSSLNPLLLSTLQTLPLPPPLSTNALTFLGGFVGPAFRSRPALNSISPRNFSLEIRCSGRLPRRALLDCGGSMPLLRSQLRHQSICEAPKPTTCHFEWNKSTFLLFRFLLRHRSACGERNLSSMSADDRRITPHRGFDLLPHFVYLSTHSKNVLYQNWLFTGFNTQCPSSGKITNFDGTPCRCNALKNSNDCVYGTR